MANVDGVIGYNSPSGTNKLLAAFGTDIVDISTGLGYGLNLSSGNKAFFEVFIDTIFFTNGVDKMRTFVEGAWSDSFSLPKQIVPKYLKKSVNNAQLLIGNCTLTPGSGTPLNYRSYVFRSNFPTLGKSLSGSAIAQSLQWGIESGRCNIAQDSKKVTAVPDGNGHMPYFKTRGIKVGDPFFLLGGDIGQYTVASIPSEYELILNETIPSTTNTNVDFWVGSNFFPVGAVDDNDQIMGFGENNSRDLIFKLFSLWYYTGSQLKQVKGAPGTNSQRSVINDKMGNTYYFHGSDIEQTGIYMYGGVNSVKISRAIDPFVQGILASNYPDIVAWQEGDELRWFVGDIVNQDENINMTNAVITINTVTNAWDVSPIADVIKCATPYIVSNVKNYYCGTDAGLVLKMNVGNDFNGTSIPAALETQVYYPSASELQYTYPAYKSKGSEMQNAYPFVQVVGKNATGLRISYKIWDKLVKDSGRQKVLDVDERWTPLGELQGDLTEFQPDIKNRIGAGLQFRIEEDGKLANTWLVEKISVFYIPDRSRLV